jgi:hypothetical protein
MRRSKKSRQAPACLRCNGLRPPQPNGICRDCDTRHMGTWYLSCISELGHIVINDTIICGYAKGVTGNNFLGVPNKTPIFCCVNEVDKNLFHAFCDTNHMEEEVWVNDYDVWWDHPSVTQIDFRVNFSIDLC